MKMETGDKTTVTQEQFDARLAELMMPDDGNGKKKKRRKWSRRRKLVTAGAVLLAAGFAASRMMGGDKAPVIPVSVTPLAQGDIQEKLVVSGPVSGTDSVDVVSNLHAEILEIPVKEGMKVEKDQVLAVIDREDVDKEISKAENAYNLAVATYEEKKRETQSGYAKAKQDYQQAQLDHQRSDLLRQTGDLSQAEWEKTQNAMLDAKRQVDLYKVQNGKAVPDDSYALQVQNAKLELDQKKELLEDIELKSPIAGTVVRVYSKVGRFADTMEDDKPLFSIENLDVLEMKINVSEYSIGKVAVGQPVVISADILNGETVQGEVTAISPTGEEKGGGSSERVIPTTIRILDTDTRLIAGITAKAEITLNEAKAAWIVPVSALLDTPEGQFVLAVEEGVIRRIPVQAGVESDIQIQVQPRDGAELTEGMQIVANPSPNLTDGMQVMVMP